MRGIRSFLCGLTVLISAFKSPGAEIKPAPQLFRQEYAQRLGLATNGFQLIDIAQGQARAFDGREWRQFESGAWKAMPQAAEPSGHFRVYDADLEFGPD